MIEAAILRLFTAEAAANGVLAIYRRARDA